MIIDVHAHLFDDPAYNETFLATCRKAGIDRICAFLSGMCSTGLVEDDPNVLPLALRDAHPAAVIPFARVNAAEGESALAELDRCVEECGMRGLKLSFDVKATNPVLFPIIEKTIELRIPILFHAYMGRELRGERDVKNPTESDVQEIVELARRYPEAMIVMSHYNLGDWEFGIKAAKCVENVYPCTSGTGVDAGSIEFGVREVGVERIIFGTDNCICAALGKIFGAKISEREKNRILGENLHELLTKRGPLP